MYSNSLHAQKSSSLDGVAVVQDKGEEMDTDQIMQILMSLREDSARRDERLQAVGGKLDKLLEFRDMRVRVVDDAILEIQKRNSEFERRLVALEGKGLAAWDTKRITQWLGLIIAGGATFALVGRLIQWLLARIHL